MTTTVPRTQAAPQPLLAGENSPFKRFVVTLFAAVLALALADAVPSAWGWVSAGPTSVSPSPSTPSPASA